MGGPEGHQLGLPTLSTSHLHNIIRYEKKPKHFQEVWLEQREVCVFYVPETHIMDFIQRS